MVLSYNCGYSNYCCESRCRHHFANKQTNKQITATTTWKSTRFYDYCLIIFPNWTENKSRTIEHEWKICSYSPPFLLFWIDLSFLFLYIWCCWLMSVLLFQILCSMSMRKAFFCLSRNGRMIFIWAEPHTNTN